MKAILKFIYKFTTILQKICVKVFIVPGLKQSFGSCGKKVIISGTDSDFRPPDNIYIDEDSTIGPYAMFWTTRAEIHIGKHVLIGPHVSIITGDHRLDYIGKNIKDIPDEEKLPENDQNVLIRNGVWIGANVTILKGVIIGEGSVVAAGSVVTKDVDPYCIYAGVPAKKIKDRFEKKDLEEHLLILNGMNDK